MCTAAYDRPTDDLEPLVTCIQCGVVIERVAVSVWIRPTRSAVACSENCYHDFEARRDD